MGKSKEIIVDSKQSKNKEPSETKLKKSKKEDISESIPIVDNISVSELDTIVETKPKKSKKDKANISELDTIVEIKKDNIIVSELDTIVETKSKKTKKDKANITELELIPIVETKSKKGKKDKVNKLESVPIVETKKTKKDKVNKLESVPIVETVETKKSNKEKEVDKSSNDDYAKNLDALIPKSSAITNPEFIILKNKWYELTKKIENLNNERDILEIDKNNFVSEMCKIIEKHQPKVENLLEQKTTTISKSTISSKLLENDSDDSDSSDSDDEIPIKKITAKKILAESSSDDDSDSD